MVALLLLASAACGAEPQRAQSGVLLDRLVAARAALAGQANDDEPCTAVGDVETRLFGEPGLGDLGSGYSALKDAAQALHAVCGQIELLAIASADTLASRQARARWQAAAQRELSVACDHLRAAASALGRATPC